MSRAGENLTQRGPERPVEPQAPKAAYAGPVGRNLSLDGLRAIACLLVYFFHLAVNLGRPPLVIQGATGVHLFFVLSGYLMFGPFLAGLIGLRPMPAWRSYAWRRFTRIYPPYAVSLVLFIAARYLTHFHPPRPANIISHILLIFNFLDTKDFFSINAVYWSLAVEAQFYVLLPIAAALSAKLIPRRGWLAAWCVIAAFAVIGIAARAFEFRLSDGPSAALLDTRFQTLFAFLDLFAAGMAVAALEVRLGDRLRNGRGTLAALTISGLALFLLANLWTGLTIAPQTWFKPADVLYAAFFPPLLCVGIGLVLLAICCRPSGWLSARPLVALGTISYSIYLYHVGVQYALGLIVARYPITAQPLPDWAFALLALPPTLLVSAVMYLAVERPSIRWGARYSQHASALRSTEQGADHS